MAEVPRGGEAGAGRVRKAVESFRPPLVRKYPKPINSGGSTDEIDEFLLIRRIQLLRMRHDSLLTERDRKCQGSKEGLE